MEDINIGKDTIIGTVTTKAIAEVINPAKLTKEEDEILELTAELWNKFLQLPIYHLMEQSEMQSKIHDIQRMIISRPGFRMNKEKFRDYGEG